MLSYLQKFNELPKNIKDAVASAEAAAVITALEKQYGISLAAMIMKIAVKEIKLDGLSAYLINQNQVPAQTANALEKDLRKKVFAPIIDYILGPAAGPKLIFAETDEKEVKAVAQPVATGDFDAAIEAAVNRVTEKTAIQFSDPLVGAKFKQTIKTYLRGTRDKVSTVEMLTKASELGGVALNRDTAERAISFAAGELTNLQKISAAAQPRFKVPEDGLKNKISPFTKIQSAPAAPVVEEYNLEAALKAEGKLKKPAEPIKTIKPIVDPAHELEPLVPAIRSVADSVSSPERQIIKEAVTGKPLDKEGLRKVTAATPKPIINMPTAPSGKIRMDDIRFTPQVLSPVDELRYMTVKTFRRLHSDPLQAIEKIKEKLELLGKEDYAKKIDGIVAWNESPLSKMYISLCRRALEENRPVTDILKDELKQEPQSLKPEELSAIIALNRQLKF